MSFNVGDRVRSKLSQGSAGAPATVTEITERGFKYKYDKPLPFHPFLGPFVGGECYAPDLYELIPSAPSATEGG